MVSASTQAATVGFGYGWRESERHLGVQGTVDSPARWPIIGAGPGYRSGIRAHRGPWVPALGAGTAKRAARLRALVRGSPWSKTGVVGALHRCVFETAKVQIFSRKQNITSWPRFQFKIFE